MPTILTKCLKSETLESGVCHGQFLISSLRPGQGITIGNHLRRVLLNDLEGVGISAVRIAGINHEFSTIPGVREDILEILLNLKGVVLRRHDSSKEIQFGHLKVQGPTVITADLITLPAKFEIVNSNHYIATLSTSNILEIEFKLESGTSYKLASHSHDDEFLEMDTLFMPVQKVDFKVENIYDSANVATERVLLEIWTNGSITPDEAFRLAIQNTIELFTLLLTNEVTPSDEESYSENEANVRSIEPYTNIAIEELQLSVRAYNCLKKVHINTVGDLLQYSPNQLQKLKNFGKKSADEVFSTLKNKLGIILK